MPTPKSRPHDPALAPDGSLWYTGQLANKLGRLDPKTGQLLAMVEYAKDGRSAGLAVKPLYPAASVFKTMDPATITASTVVLKASDGTVVATTLSYDGGTNTVTLTPAALLAPTATYTASVTTGATGA